MLEWPLVSQPPLLLVSSNDPKLLACNGSSTNTSPGPFELAKNVVQTSVLVSHRHQAEPDAIRDPKLRNARRLGTFQAFKQITQRHGLLGLYTGYHLHALRDTIGTGLYFGIYETVKQIITKELGKQQSPFGAPMVAGALCGTIPWILVGHFNPFPFMGFSRYLSLTSFFLDLFIGYSQDSRPEHPARED